MFFLFTPDGNRIVGDSQLVQDARDRGEQTFAVEAHGHEYRIQIHGHDTEYSRLSVLSVDGKPVSEDEIGKPIPPDAGGGIEAVSDNVSMDLVGDGAGIIAVQDGQGPGRNDPCPCGSGRKFKKCHGR